jgi:nucleotide-binding universal stress UspA family protein
MATHTPSIVVACDGSAHSLNAAKVAAQLSKALNHPLKLLTVFPGSRAERLIISGIWPSDLDQQQKEYGQKVFDSAQKALDGKVEPSEHIVLRGDPAHEITDYLEDHPGSHMVLGRRGHSLMRSLTLGSVSEKVMRHATGPVTIVGD